MRLHYLAGDRTGAVRLFEACCEMLKKEFNIEPSENTLNIYCQIVRKRVAHPEVPNNPSKSRDLLDPPNCRDALEEIKLSVVRQETVQRQLLEKIQIIENALLRA
jgi:hypothetical protein